MESVLCWRMFCARWLMAGSLGSWVSVTRPIGPGLHMTSRHTGTRYLCLSRLTVEPDLARTDPTTFLIIVQRSHGQNTVRGAGRSIFAIFGTNPRCCPGIITAEWTWNMFLLGLVLMCPLQYMSYRQYNCHKNGKNNRRHYYFSKIPKLWFIIYCKPVYHTLLDILIAYVETNLLKCFCFRSAECFV